MHQTEVEGVTAAPQVSVSDARLTSVLDTAADGIIVIDDNARILMFNKACENLFGYSAGEMLGRNVKSLMPGQYASHHDQYLSNYIGTGVRKIIGIGREVLARHRDGTVIPVELSVGEAVTPDGRQFIGILRDLRPRREAEQRLSQLQSDLMRLARVSAMDEMGAALAHELNQPLTALMLYLQAVRIASTGQDRVPETGHSILEKAFREAERAGNIIQRMRQFIERRDPLRRNVDITPLVEDAIELTLLGHGPGNRVVRILANNLPKVFVDPVQIQQVIVNLLRNAIEAVANAPNPEITIRTQAEPNHVTVTIEDNGRGIPESAIPDLFKAFTSSSKNAGMGLGLAISKTIAQTHGGDLAVDPGGKGRGAAFTLIIPVAGPTEPADEASTENA